MATQLEIWNGALNVLGHRGGITDLVTDVTPDANKVRDAWDDVYLPTIGGTEWSYLTRYSDALTPSTTDSPLGSHPFMYAIPADVLTIRYVFLAGSGPRTNEPLAFERFKDATDGEVFATTTNNVQICYSANDVAITDIPGDVVKVLKYALAEEVCMRVTGSLDVKLQVEEKLRRARNMAAIDTYEGRIEQAPLPSDLAARE